MAEATGSRNLEPATLGEVGGAADQPDRGSEVAATQSLRRAPRRAEQSLGTDSEGNIFELTQPA